MMPKTIPMLKLNPEVTGSDRLGYTLFELLLVVLLLAIISAVVLPSFQPTVHDQLRATARLVASELELARNLAITYNSNYRVTIDVPNNRILLSHVGSNTQLNQLPRELVDPAADNRSVRVLDLKAIQSNLGDVRIVVSAEVSTVLVASNVIEFNPAGVPASGKGFLIWLAAGRDPYVRYMTVLVDGVTGKVTTGPLDTLPPPQSLLTSGA